MIVVVTGGSFNLSAQEGSALSRVIAEYVDVKEALVVDNFLLVKKEVPALKEALADAPVQGEEQRQLVEAVDALAMASDIQSQRQAFATLSDLLLDVVKEQDLDKTLYVQYCPMALDGEGASWISLQKQVQNPFMGQKMPKCGSVKETI